MTLAWQLAFLVISRDVIRYRLLMLPAVAEKLFFVASTFALYASGRVSAYSIPTAVVDLALGVLFTASFFACGNIE